MNPRIAAALALLVLAGCRARTCESLCDDQKGCPNATDQTTAVDCGATCAAASRWTDERHCQSAYAEYLDCQADGDVCDPDAIARCNAKVASCGW